MKKIAVLISCIIVLFLFTACSEQKEFEPIEKFSCTISYKNTGVEYKANLKLLKGGILEVLFLSPSSINGIKYSYNGQDCTISYNDLNVFTIPKNSIIEALNDCFTAIQNKSANLIFNNDKYSFKTNDFTIFLNKEGYPESFEFNDIKINFSDVKIIN